MSHRKSSFFLFHLMEQKLDHGILEEVSQQIEALLDSTVMTTILFLFY
jgi:hypothetical protein